MARSLYISFRNQGFWAYDVPAAVFLKFLIDAATDQLAVGTDKWLGEAIEHWRVSAVITEMPSWADDEWTQAQIDTVVELCRTATQAIRSARDIPASQVEAWPILDDMRICARGHDPIPCEPVARLGEAFAALLQDRLPDPPAGRRWFFGLDEKAE